MKIDSKITLKTIFYDDDQGIYKYLPIWSMQGISLAVCKYHNIHMHIPTI